MFCQFCGTEATHELNYCKRCGGNLNRFGGMQEITNAPATLSPKSVWGIGLTTAAIVIFGLIVLLVSISEMVSLSSFSSVAAVWIALFGALTIISSVALLMRLWMRLLGNASLQTEQRLPTQIRCPPVPTNELPPQRISALPPESIGSVTEHTTRTFDHAYRERQG